MLGEGSFGCVLSQPVPCAEKNNYTGPKVGKVLDQKSSYTQDWNFAQRLSRIDPTQSYFIFPIDACIPKTVEIREVMAKLPLEDCDNIRTTMSIYPDKPVYQLIMPRADKDLRAIVKAPADTFKNKYSFKQFLSMCENLMQGLTILANHKISQFDIKYDNLILHDDKIKIIDFGLAKTFNDVYAEKSFNRLKSLKFWYPPEYNLISRLLLNVSFSWFNINKELRDKNITRFFSIDEIQAHKAAAEKEILAMKGKQNWSKIHQQLNKYTDRVDIYGAGHTLSTFVNHVYPEVVKDYQNGKKTTYGRLGKWISFLIHPNFKKRYTPRKALHELKAIITAA